MDGKRVRLSSHARQPYARGSHPVCNSALRLLRLPLFIDAIDPLLLIHLIATNYHHPSHHPLLINSSIAQLSLKESSTPAITITRILPKDEQSTADCDAIRDAPPLAPLCDDIKLKDFVSVKD